GVIMSDPIALRVVPGFARHTQLSLLVTRLPDKMNRVQLKRVNGGDEPEERRPRFKDRGIAKLFVKRGWDGGARIEAAIPDGGNAREIVATPLVDYGHPLCAGIHADVEANARRKEVGVEPHGLGAARRQS